MICIVIVNWLDGSGNGKLFGATLSISREFATLNFDLVVLNFKWPLKMEKLLYSKYVRALLFLRS